MGCTDKPADKPTDFVTILSVAILLIVLLWLACSSLFSAYMYRAASRSDSGDALGLGRMFTAMGFTHVVICAILVLVLVWAIAARSSYGLWFLLGLLLVILLLSFFSWRR